MLNLTQIIGCGIAQDPGVLDGADLHYIANECNGSVLVNRGKGGSPYNAQKVGPQNQLGTFRNGFLSQKFTTGYDYKRYTLGSAYNVPSAAIFAMVGKLNGSERVVGFGGDSAKGAGYATFFGISGPTYGEGFLFRDSVDAGITYAYGSTETIATWVGTKDGASISLYLNGSLVATGTAGGGFRVDQVGARVTQTSDGEIWECLLKESSAGELANDLDEIHNYLRRKYLTW